MHVHQNPIAHCTGRLEPLLPIVSCQVVQVNTCCTKSLARGGSTLLLATKTAMSAFMGNKASGCLGAAASVDEMPLLGQACHGPVGAHGDRFLSC